MEKLNKYWQVYASIIGFIFAAGMLYSSVGAIPEMDKKIQNHEVRLTSMEQKLDYIKEGVDDIKLSIRRKK